MNCGESEAFCGVITKFLKYRLRTPKNEKNSEKKFKKDSRWVSKYKYYGNRKRLGKDNKRSVTV